MDAAKRRQHGRCLCGAVRFTVSGPTRGVIYCHCEQCRRQTGHFVAATSVSLDHLDVDGTSDISWYRASAAAARGFCRICGSVLFWKPDGEARMSIMAGSFDLPTGLEGQAHIFVADKGDYYELADDLPKHDAG